MTVTATDAAATTAPKSNFISGKSNDLSSTFDTFLKLLTTQMKNQDPLKPMDNAEYTNQLVQFTQAEQAMGTNSRLDHLISGQKRGALSEAVAYIGKTVRVDSKVLELKNKTATINYGLTRKSATTQIEIRDKDNNLMRTLQGATAKGLHNLDWNGQDDTGKQLPDGTYSFKLIAKDSHAQTIQTAQGIVGKVNGIEMEKGAALLSIGQVKIPASAVSAILPPATVAEK